MKRKALVFDNSRIIEISPCCSDIAASSRAQSFLVAGLYLFGIANGITDRVVDSIATEGILAALMDTFGISVVVIAAAAVGLRLALQAPNRPIDRLDCLVIAIYLLGLCVPRSFASMAALTFFAAYEGIRARHSAETTAAASLFVGIAVCHFWGRVVLQLFALPVLGVDAALVATLLNLLQVGGVEHVGNLVNTAQGQSLVILPRCSSLSNISYTLLCWLTIIRASRPAWRKTDLSMMPVVVIGVIFLNVLRMTLMGISRELYLLVHGSAGANVTSSFILIMAIAVAWYTLGPDPDPV